MEKTKKENSFEENIEELSKIVEKLEAGEIPLDDAIDEFQKAMKIAKTCDEKLKKAEEAIHKIVSNDDEVTEFQIEE